MNRPAHKIPIVEPERFVEDVRAIPIDSTHVRYREPMVNLDSTTLAFSSYYARGDGNNPPFFRRIESSSDDIWLRKTVVAKLERVNRNLRPYGVEMLVLTGYVSPACLSGLWDFHLDRARRKIGGTSESDWKEYAQKYVRDPDLFNATDPTTWPAHTTGAAVDLTLRETSAGRILDMGSNFEEITEESHSDHYERLLADHLIAEDDERLQNRRLLHWAMSREGFVNEPPLYWHYDWGNQLYVKTCRGLRGQAPRAAWYGFAGGVSFC